MKTIIVAILAAVLAAPAFAEDVVGKWTGILKTPDRDLTAIVTVQKGPDGKLSSHLESPNEAGTMLLPAEDFVSDGASFSFVSATLQGSYSSTWDAGKKAWVGVWKQRGVEMPLELRRVP